MKRSVGSTEVSGGDAKRRKADEQPIEPLDAPAATAAAADAMEDVAPTDGADADPDDTDAYRALIRRVTAQVYPVDAIAGREWQLQAVETPFRIVPRDDTAPERTTAEFRLRLTPRLREISYFTEIVRDAAADVLVPANLPYARQILTGTPLPREYDIVGAMATWTYYNLDTRHALAAFVWCLGASEARFREWYEPENAALVGVATKWVVRHRAPSETAAAADNNCVAMMVRHLVRHSKGNPHTAFALGARWQLAACDRATVLSHAVVSSSRRFFEYVVSPAGIGACAEFDHMLRALLSHRAPTTDHRLAPLLRRLVRWRAPLTDAQERLVFRSAMDLDASDVLQVLHDAFPEAMKRHLRGDTAYMSAFPRTYGERQLDAAFPNADASHEFQVRALVAGRFDAFAWMYRHAETPAARITRAYAFTCLAYGAHTELCTRVEAHYATDVDAGKAQFSRAALERIVTHASSDCLAHVNVATDPLPADLLIAALRLRVGDAATRVCHARRTGAQVAFFEACLDADRVEDLEALWRLPSTRGRLMYRVPARARSSARWSRVHAAVYAAPFARRAHAWLTTSVHVPVAVGACDWLRRVGLMHDTYAWLARVLPDAPIAQWTAHVQPSEAAATATADLSAFWRCVKRRDQAAHLVGLRVPPPPDAIEAYLTLPMHERDMDVVLMMRGACAPTRLWSFVRFDYGMSSRSVIRHALLMHRARHATPDIELDLNQLGVLEVVLGTIRAHLPADDVDNALDALCVDEAMALLPLAAHTHLNALLAGVRPLSHAELRFKEVRDGAVAFVRRVDAQPNGAQFRWRASALAYRDILLALTPHGRTLAAYLAPAVTAMVDDGAGSNGGGGVFATYAEGIARCDLTDLAFVCAQVERDVRYSFQRVETVLAHAPMSLPLVLWLASDRQRAQTLVRAHELHAAWFHANRTAIDAFAAHADPATLRRLRACKRADVLKRTRQSARLTRV
jgi:hypothetical protein